MILRSTPASPFVRKVRIAIGLLGLADKIEIQETDLNDPADTIRRQNPLGKIPALLLDDGSVLYDSRVILEYLDHLAGGGKIIPREPAARFAALCLQALCDGVLDASVLIVYENRYRKEEQRVQGWIDRQAGKVKRALGAIEAAPPALTPMPGRSRSPACSAIAISASAAAGARTIRACLPGTTLSPRKCRLSRPPHRRDN
jgi:glutathione S-transferase